MSNFTPVQVYERVPFHKMEPDAVLLIGMFECPNGDRAGIPVELRVLSPAAVSGPWNSVTSTGLGTLDPIGMATFTLPLWSLKVCGTEIEYEVRGLWSGLYTPWERFKGVVGPRSDDDRQWVRKLDGDMHIPPLAYQPVKRWYPATLDQLLWCVRNHHEVAGPVSESRSAGSHWGISYTSVTPGQMYETATPVHEKDGDQLAARLNNVLYDVIPGCLTLEAWAFFKRQQVHVFNPKLPVNEVQNYLFHVEAGMRIYELYAYADSEADGAEPRSFAVAIEAATKASTKQPPEDWPCYLGPWALETMGGAGGQTIVGVASTATHGGDVWSSAIGDMVVAMHLIAPDGQEYWIERTQIRPGTWPLKLVDETLLRKVYRVHDPKAPGGAQRTKEIIYKRDDNLMNAALVSCGRMGVIYSVVLRAIRQFALNQATETSTWTDTKKWICNPSHPKYAAVFKNRFVRVDVDLYPSPEFDWDTASWAFAFGAFTGPIGALAGVLIGLKGDEYRTWHVTRTIGPLQDAVRQDDNGQNYFYGRKERGGEMAGKGTMLDIEPDKGYFTDPCGSANFVRQFMTDMVENVGSIREDALAAWLLAGAAKALFPPNAIWVDPLQALLIRVITFAEFWRAVLLEVRYMLPEEAKLGDFLCTVMNVFGAMHAHSIVQMLYAVGQDSEHHSTDKPLVAASYAVMDQHNYQNRGCVAPGDSIELFFDASKPDFIGFVDFVLNEVRDLADDGKVWAGFLSMRFMTSSPSHLAMQQWPRTLSMEIASLSEASGAAELLERIEEESNKRGIVIHWGQRNNRKQDDIEKQFVMIGKWRNALSELSEHGRLANLSTEFTRIKGLEITEPRLYELKASLTDGCASETTTITYNGFKNPPGTKLTLVQIFEKGGGKTFELPEMSGTIGIPLGEGRSTLQLHALRVLNEHKYEAPPLQTSLHGFRTGDFWEFQLQTELRVISGVQRWFAEINLFSVYISNALRVSEVQLNASSVAGWVLRKPETGDVNFAGMMDIRPLPSLPVFNTNWQFFSAGAAMAIAPPVLTVRFKILC